MEPVKIVTLVNDDQQALAAPRLLRQCKKRKVDYACGDSDDDIEAFKDASASYKSNEEMLLKEDNLKTPTVQNKAKESDFNFPRIYKRLVDCCERELYRIHKKDPGCTDKTIKGSSVDKRQLYIDFNAGMFGD